MITTEFWGSYLEDSIILSGDTVLMPTENSRKEFAN